VQHARVLNEAACYELLAGTALVDRLADGFVALSRGEVVAPTRVGLATESGFSLAMPAHLAGGHIVVKIVNVFEGNPAHGLPSHQAVICAFDESTGSCVAILDGTAITARRTAGAAALSARILAREDARVLTIVGAGVQGRAHLEVLPLVRDLEEIRIASLERDHAERLAALDGRATAVDSVADAVRSSDIVSLCTHSGEPVIDADWIRPGTHVTSVGYREPLGELPRGLLDRASLFVETRLAFEPTPVGCYELQGIDPAGGTELGEVLAAIRPGRRSDDEITVYKAMGHAVEDHVATELVLSEAQRVNASVAIDL
jgi:ornithine cyclodeaminase/alanine dehydrogenase-like protein (mu-crystallin family)